MTLAKVVSERRQQLYYFPLVVRDSLLTPHAYLHFHQFTQCYKRPDMFRCYSQVLVQWNFGHIPCFLFQSSLLSFKKFQLVYSSLKNGKHKKLQICHLMLRGIIHFYPLVPRLKHVFYRELNIGFWSRSYIPPSGAILQP